MVDVAVERFAELMDSGTPLYVAPIVLALAACVFVLVVLHELGHAVVALACTQSLVVVRVGRDPGALRGRIGRLAFSLDVRPSKHPDDAVTGVMADLSRRERVAYALAGPGANLVLALVLVPSFAVQSGVSRYALGAVIATSLVLALLNLISRDETSDGQLALAALRDEIPDLDGDEPLTGEMADDLGRWMALYWSSRDGRFSRQRALLFAGAPYELGVEPHPSNREARAYWDDARAGWCWREVRPVGAEELAGAPRRAWQNQAREGRSGLELAGAAAAELARSRSEDDVDEAFLATNELRDGTVADERTRFAFRFGVALHDVERAMADQGQRYW